MLLPADIGDYTDFYASIFHATNVGQHVPARRAAAAELQACADRYHGRASSVVPSGTPVSRPVGQVKPEAPRNRSSRATRRLDYELEVGAFIGPGNDSATPIPIERAEQHLFGVCLLNDWSARDIQMWDYQPLGPFLAKSFATSIISMDRHTRRAGAFSRAAFRRPDGDPAPLPYLDARGA